MKVLQYYSNLCLPLYSPFLNPIEEYERQPYTIVNLQAMGRACGDLGVPGFSPVA